MQNQVLTADPVTVEPRDLCAGEAPFAEVLAQVLRPPYVWWLLFAVVLQAYSPLYVSLVALEIVIMTVLCARRSVSERTAVESSSLTR